MKNSLGRFVDWLLRVTSRPAASEIRNAGTWLTNPSPIVSVVNTSAAVFSDMSASTMPMNSPPTMLISVIIIPAIASPRTNLLAPSKAPKKSACWVISSRRLCASRSSIVPALRSASIAIWRPGIPSKAKRAATSLIRVAPLVMTMNWINTMIAKMMMPTTMLPRATKSPNVLITSPAASGPSVSARVRINRVVATFNTRRNNVVARSSEGKMLNSSGVRTKTVVSSIMTAMVMFSDSSMSINTGGSGTRITSTLQMIPTGKMRSLMRFKKDAASARGDAAVAIRVSGCALELLAI